MTYDAGLTTILDREPEPTGGVIGHDVDYSADGTAFRGYVAKPADGATGAAVLVTHDWLGVTDTTRMRCDMLARVGYTAFAVDVFGADTRPSPAEAPTVVGRFYGDRGLFRERLTAGFERLLEEPGVDAARIAAIGYCFGGSGALELARSGAPLAAAVCFHGRLPTGPEEEAHEIRAKLLVLTGGADPGVPDTAIAAWQDDLRRAPEVDWQVVVYSGAMHAFTVPSANAPDHGAQYDATADSRSWTAMKDFFRETIG